MSELPATHRKRPVSVACHQWWRNGDHPLDALGEKLLDPFTGVSYERLEGAVVRFFRHPDIEGTRSCGHCGVTMHDHGWIETLEGGHIVCPGDWIITGVHNERYPCKPDIFGATYEALRPNAEIEHEEMLDFLRDNGLGYIMLALLRRAGGGTVTLDAAELAAIADDQVCLVKRLDDGGVVLEGSAAR